MDNRTLDKEIAEKFLEWTDIVEDAYTPSGRHLCGTHPSKKGGFDGQGRFIVPRYTERPLAAIALVLDEIERRGWTLSLLLLPDAVEVHLYTDYWNQRVEEAILIQNPRTPDAIWRTICEAALQAAAAERE